MKCGIPEISWHNREPVLSVAIHPVIIDDFYRLATGGADCHVLIWSLNICDNGSFKIEALSDLTRHQRAVNSVRWSSTGQYLASADDDANIIIWQLKTDNIPLLEGETNDKEVWIVHKVMRGHKEDIYDLCWSPDDSKLFSGSVDNTAIVWDLNKGKSDKILSDHKGFVQGVSWDPKGHYLATISTDRICRIYESTGKVKFRIQRGCLPVPENHFLYKKEVKFFHDDTFKSFFRRLDFSPDGSLLAVPSGHVQIEDSKETLSATYLFAVDSWTEPVAILPSDKQCSTVVRFCPLLFELHEDGPESVVSLPFRMIVAVGTDHDVILYDTQQVEPFAYFRNIHYTRLTDLTWSKDGLLLVASSTDGFCAVITFEPNELGVLYVKEESETEDNPMDVSGCEALLDVDDKNTSEVSTPKPKKPNLLEKWTIKTPKSIKHDAKNTKIEKQKDDITKSVDNAKRKVLEVNENKPAPKRIKPIPVVDSKDGEQVQKDCPLPKPSGAKVIKSSPLLTFLKRVNKTGETKKVKPVTPQSTSTVILDEAEARDAWKCEKNKENVVEETKNDIIVEDESLEDFSLHIEDSNATTLNSKSDGPQPTQVVAENIAAENDSNKVNGEEAKVQDTEVAKPPKVQETESKPHSSSSSDLALNPTDNSKIAQKRRIPLITLSSPKTKKK